MLQVDALLDAGSSRSGLLQDHAHDAGAFRTDPICSRHPQFTRIARNGSNSVDRPRGQLVESRDRGALPRTSALPLVVSYTSARLV
jgi:hypothetical protein